MRSLRLNRTLKRFEICEALLSIVKEIPGMSGVFDRILRTLLVVGLLHHHRGRWAIGEAAGATTEKTGRPRFVPGGPTHICLCAPEISLPAGGCNHWDRFHRYSRRPSNATRCPADSRSVFLCTFPASPG